MKKGHTKNVFICIVVIVLLCAILMLSGGCSGQRTTLPDGTVIDTWCIAREFSSQGSELYYHADPNGTTYWLLLGTHKSKTSAGKIKATHPTGIGIEVVTE